MSKIKIKNFGPIKEGMLDNDGWIDIKKVTVFIGNQGSGKSTVAKAISTLSWLEKSINRGDTDKDKITFALFKELFEYHKINNYFTKSTYIEYIGERYQIIYNKTDENISVSEIKKESYIVPKIMYVPAERNFLSTISDAFNVKGLPENVFTFAEELRKAQNELNNRRLRLPLKSYSYGYNESEKTSYILGTGYKINLLEASSGLQSFVPLFLVSRYLSNVIFDTDISLKRNMSVTQSIRMDKEISDLVNNLSAIAKEQEIEKIRARYYNKCFINIIEEPEQNLFPTSQRQMLNSLLEFNNMNKGNKLIMTTHSPYLINYLTLAVKADMVSKANLNSDSKNKLNKIVPQYSIVKSNDLVIYELNENDGTIKILPDYRGLPSDENYLNSRLEDSNELFAQLQEIEKGWR